MGALVVSIFAPSGDGNYYGRYPDGNAPLGGTLESAASDTTTATGALGTGIDIAGAPSDSSAATGAVTTGIMADAAGSASSAGTGALTTKIEMAAAASDSTAATGALSTGSGGGGATQVFTYPNFASTAGIISSGGSFESPPSPDVIQLCGDVVHDAGQGWYHVKQNITAFTTQFTFSVGAGPPPQIGYGFSFTVHNDPNGTSSGGDSNGLGFAQYSTSINPLGTATTNSVTIAFNSTPNVGTGYGWFGANPSSIGLYVWGGPYIDNGLSPTQDLIPQGINLQSGHVYSAYVVYDGTILSVELTDTTTGVIAYASWPIDIPAIVGADTAWIGVGAGAGESSGAVPQTFNSWTWWSGYDERLASPTFSVTPGQYATTQTLEISGPADATIYYTTNGTPPTEASSVYSGPLEISSSTIVQAIASQSNWTDSYPVLADYQIQASGLPKINYPSGFTGAGGRIATNGTASISGSSLVLTDTVSESGAEVGSAFYVAPVLVSSFSTVFEFQFTGNTFQNGLAFVIQNQVPASVSSTWNSQPGNCVSGGPNALGFPVYGQHDIGAGYAGILQSVALVFDGWNKVISQVTNGAVPPGTGTAPSTINFQSGHVIQVSLSYNGTTLSISVKDMTTNVTYSWTWTVNIPSLVGADTAWVGFTASEWTPHVEQAVLNWTYTEG
jgi:Chitobiase/beta-hexosaminidase C-terminal domain/Legume lectin domain